jgi:signal transduction histidine kinase
MQPSEADRRFSELREQLKRLLEKQTNNAADTTRDDATHIWQLLDALQQALADESRALQDSHADALQLAAANAEREQNMLTEALLQVTTRLSESLDLDAVLDHILAMLRQVVPYDGANLMMLDRLDATKARIVRIHGYNRPQLASWMHSQTFDIEQIAGFRRMVDTQQPLVVPYVEKQADWSTWDLTHGIRSYVGVPIIVDEEAIAFLNLDSFHAGFYNQSHARKLQAFAHHAAIALRNAQAHERDQQLAALQERQHLARELHDAVSQNLFAAASMTQALKGIVEANPTLVREELHNVSQLLIGAQAEMRTLLLELRPEMLKHASLPQLLSQLVDSLRTRRQIEVETDMPLHEDPPDKVKLTLFRIAQESLSNVAKHASASRVRLKLYRDDSDGSFNLHVEDNGIGFDASNGHTGRFGLLGMRERAHENGMTLKIDSSPGDGTIISVRSTPSVNTGSINSGQTTPPFCD